jgi:hypothetical protein
MLPYNAYQLHIQADFAIPEFPGAAEAAAADVFIRYGQTPAALENVTGQGVLYQANNQQFLLNMAGIARYLVQNGSEIIVEPAADSLESDVRVFLLGSCLGALLHQRGLLVLHAGAIFTQQGAVLFTGHSGAGKSTLVGEMMRRGYKMMVDDVCALTLGQDGAPLVLPGYARTRLWSDAAKKLEQDTRTMTRTRAEMEKFESQVPDQFYAQPAPMRRIYLLTASNKDDLKLQALPRIHTFSIILHNTYRQQFLDGLEMRAPHFGLVAAVAKHSGVTQITRPTTPFRLTELGDLVEKDLVEKPHG